MKWTSAAITQLAFLLLLPEAPALSQTVQGYVLESGSEAPVVMAEVTLLDTAMAVIDQTYSAHDGYFTVSAPGPGRYYLRAGALGYRTKLDGIVELGEGGLLPVTFFLVPEPLPVEGLEATAERQQIERFLEDQGFYQRREAGFGYFITPEEIEERSIRDYHRLFQRIPVKVEGGLSFTELHIRGRCDPRSYPTVWVNGALVSVRWGRLGGGMEELVEVSDILAVEVYAGPASTPLQWSGTKLIGGGCGTIVIWTRGGR